MDGAGFMDGGGSTNGGGLHEHSIRTARDVRNDKDRDFVDVVENFARPE
ncbi:hypothetical protein [Streptosporangium sp. NPDC002721]